MLAPPDGVHRGKESRGAKGHTQDFQRGEQDSSQSESQSQQSVPKPPQEILLHKLKSTRLLHNNEKVFKAVNGGVSM